MDGVTCGTDDDAVVAVGTVSFCIGGDDDVDGAGSVVYTLFASSCAVFAVVGAVVDSFVSSGSSVATVAIVSFTSSHLLTSPLLTEVDVTDMTVGILLLRYYLGRQPRCVSFLTFRIVILISSSQAGRLRFAL